MFWFQNTIIMKHNLILLIIAFLNLITWLAETLLNGWAGMAWLDYYHISFLVIPIFSIGWVVYYSKEFSPFKHLFIYPIFLLMIGYMVPGMIQLRQYMITWERVMAPLLLFMTVLFVLNVAVALIEKRKLYFFEYVILFFSSAIIPIACGLLTFLIFTQSYLFPAPVPDPVENLTDIFHWLKTGSVFFVISMYEGLYFLYLKGLVFNKARLTLKSPV